MSVVTEFGVPAAAYPLGEPLARYPSVALEVERIVPTGGSTHYVWVEGPDRGAFVDHLRQDGLVTDLETVDTLADRQLVRFEWADQRVSLLDLLEGENAALVELRGTADGWRVAARFPDPTAMRRFVATCRAHDFEVRPGDPRRPPTSDVDEFGLTPHQTEALLTAFELGYFEIPRGIALRELATHLGVSEQAASERLRRGLSGLLSRALDEDRRD